MELSGKVGLLDSRVGQLEHEQAMQIDEAGADIAEWLPLKTLDEPVEAGDVSDALTHIGQHAVRPSCRPLRSSLVLHPQMSTPFNSLRPTYCDAALSQHTCTTGTGRV